MAMKGTIQMQPESQQTANWKAIKPPIHKSIKYLKLLQSDERNRFKCYNKQIANL